MNRSSTPKGSAPRITKPVHVPNRGVAEAPAAFLRDGDALSGPLPRAMQNLPMFAPITGPRLTPEEAPGKPDDWAPHRPDRPTPSAKGRQKNRFRLETAYTPAGDQPAAIAELVAQAQAGERDQCRDAGDAADPRNRRRGWLPQGRQQARRRTVAGGNGFRPPGWRRNGVRRRRGRSHCPEDLRRQCEGAR
jgi:hypothetical protein